MSNINYTNTITVAEQLQKCENAKHQSSEKPIFQQMWIHFLPFQSKVHGKT